MTPSSRLATAAVRALADLGVREVVLCPGSRSAPLAYALDDVDRGGGRLRLHVRHDERAAAYTALGMAAQGVPSVVVTTSGTAVANLMPAVLEARHSGLPLVLLTADRPRRLRGTWANQTTELQAALFADVVRSHVDLDDADEPEAWPAALQHCLRAALGDPGRRPGPVHVNLGLSEPLVPQGDSTILADGPRLPSAAAGVGPGPVDGGPVRLEPGPRTVVVAGDRSGPTARDLAERTGWPLLAEPSSGARHGSAAIGPYRLLLENETLGAVERVVVHGRPTLSRPVTRLLERDDVDLVLVTPWQDWPEPGRPVRRTTAVEPASGADPSAGWADAWSRAGRVAQAAVDDVLDRQARLSGPAVARAVVRTATAGDSLVVAASNPVRDLDLVAGSLPDGVQVLANRGLSGIDGTLSTAVGHALATGRPVRALVGDLAFLHDLNGLELPPGERVPTTLQVVVVNDGGGGIFSLLEYGALAERDAANAQRFERLFGTPHSTDLGALCRGVGIAHRRVATPAELDGALRRPGPGISVVEVPVARSGLRPLHARLRDAVHAALDALSPPVLDHDVVFVDPA